MKSITAIAVLLLTACASSNLNDVQPGDADRAVAGSNARFTADTTAGNIDRMMSFYSDSAVVMPPNEGPVSGRDAIRQFWTGMLGAYSVSDFKLITDDVTQSCDLAAERGHYDLTMTPKAGGPAMHDVGKYVVVRRKVNGQWKAVTDMFSSNMAVPH